MRPNISRGEAECGRVLSLLFPGHLFQNQVRPSWLLYGYPGRRTPPRPLELDYYCPELKLAVEYHGEQHRKVVPLFHGYDEHAFMRFRGQLLRDAAKGLMCRGHGVDLIIVWYDLGLDQIEGFLSAHPFVINRKQTMLTA